MSVPTKIQVGDTVDGPSVNEVRLVGRLAAPAEQRELPSGDELVTFRLVVERPRDRSRRRQVDTLVCAAWSGRVRRAALAWKPGDLVEVTGALRRRFFKMAGVTTSRVEVEAVTGRVLRRSTSG